MSSAIGPNDGVEHDVVAHLPFAELLLRNVKAVKGTLLYVVNVDEVARPLGTRG